LTSRFFIIKKGFSQTSHWGDVTTGEVDSMVRGAIKRGEQAITNEATANGKAHPQF
jgi:hypothetical protein